jgi:hypothetical protein
MPPVRTVFTIRSIPALCAMRITIYRSCHRKLVTAELVTINPLKADLGDLRQPSQEWYKYSKVWPLGEHRGAYPLDQHLMQSPPYHMVQGLAASLEPAVIQ